MRGRASCTGLCKSWHDASTSQGSCQARDQPSAPTQALLLPPCQDECCPWSSFPPAPTALPSPFCVPPAGMCTALGALCPPAPPSSASVLSASCPCTLSSTTIPTQLLRDPVTSSLFSKNQVQEGFSPCGRGPQEEGVEQREQECRGSEGLELFLESLRAGEPEPKTTMNRWAAAQSSRPQIGKSPGVHRTGSFIGTPLQTPTLLGYQPPNPCLGVAIA